jgi:hypothetical protein
MKTLKQCIIEIMIATKVDATRIAKVRRMSHSQVEKAFKPHLEIIQQLSEVKS